MSTNEPRRDDARHPDADLAALQRETERVGVDWDEVARQLLTDHAELAPDDEEQEELTDETAIGLDARLLLPVLRALPDGAGTAAFIEALERREID